MTILAEADLLQAIRDRPDDDAPRLAYADLLERQGDADRAELIRLQVRHAVMPWMHPDRHAVERRISALRWQRRGGWLEHLPQRPGLSWDFDRGMPEVVSFSSYTSFRSACKAVAAQSPRRWEIVFRDSARLAGSPALAQVRELRVYGNNALGDAWLLALLRSPHLGRLTRLELVYVHFTDAALHALADCEALSGLRHLKVESTSRLRSQFTADGLAALAASPHLRQLDHLHLEHCQINDEAAAVLFATPNLAGLRRLDLRFNAIGPDGVRALRDLPAAGLAYLCLTGNRLGDEGAAHVARASRLTALRELFLPTNMIGQAGAEALAAADHLRGLEWLLLANNAIPDAGAEALAGSPNLGGLRGLDVSNNLIGDVGLLAFGRSRALGRLTAFSSSGNPARAVLARAVEERYKTQAPPLTDAPPAPPPVVGPAVAARAVGPADEDGILAAIVADPGDETVRLIYADWLEENGAAELAELVRLGRNANVTDQTPRRAHLVSRLSEAIRSAYPRYIYRVAFDAGLPQVWMQIRGVLTQAFDTTAPAWLRRHHVHELCLDGRTQDWTRLGNVSALSQVRCLSLSACRIGNAGAAALGASPHLSGLFSLNLRDNRIYEDGVVKLFRGGGLPRLRSVNLAWNRPGLEGLRALGDCPAAENLARLELSYTWPQTAGVAVLAGSPRLGNLVHLNLSACRLPDQALQALADSPHLGRLAELALSRNQFTDAGVLALVRSPLLPRLRWLALDGNQGITDDGARALAHALRPHEKARLTLSRYPLSEPCREEVSEVLGGRIAWR